MFFLLSPVFRCLVGDLLASRPRLRRGGARRLVCFVLFFRLERFVVFVFRLVCSCFFLKLKNTPPSRGHLVCFVVFVFILFLLLFSSSPPAPLLPPPPPLFLLFLSPFCFAAFVVFVSRAIFEGVATTVELTAYTGVAAFNIGFGAKSACSASNIFPNAKFQKELKGNLGI